jgi:hypothetical protein
MKATIFLSIFALLAPAASAHPHDGGPLAPASRDHIQLTYQAAGHIHSESFKVDGIFHVTEEGESMSSQFFNPT